MKLRLLVASANIGFMLLSMIASTVDAAEIKVLCSRGFSRVIEDIGPNFERATGHKLAITFGITGAVVKRVQDGEIADVVILPEGIDSFVKDGKAAAGNVTVIARSGFGLAVRKGAPKPDISSPEALKRTLLAAKSITYPRQGGDGAAGIHVAKVLDRLGIANEMKSKTVFPTDGSVLDGVANGEAEIGMQHIHELMARAGIDVVGLLPADLQDTIIFRAAIMSNIRDTAAAKALVDFLRTPEAAVIRAKGMEPANLY